MEPNQPFESAIVRKKITYTDLIDGQLIVSFTPKDTQFLLPGKYYYQVKLEKKNISLNTAEVFTVINKTLIIILE